MDSKSNQDKDMQNTINENGENKIDDQNNDAGDDTKTTSNKSDNIGQQKSTTSSATPQDPVVNPTTPPSTEPPSQGTLTEADQRAPSDVGENRTSMGSRQAKHTESEVQVPAVTDELEDQRRESQTSQQVDTERGDELSTLPKRHVPLPDWEPVDIQPIPTLSNSFSDRPYSQMSNLDFFSSIQVGKLRLLQETRQWRDTYRVPLRELEIRAIMDGRPNLRTIDLRPEQQSLATTTMTKELDIGRRMTVEQYVDLVFNDIADMDKHVK